MRNIQLNSISIKTLDGTLKCSVYYNAVGYDVSTMPSHEVAAFSPGNAKSTLKVLILTTTLVHSLVKNLHTNMHATIHVHMHTCTAIKVDNLLPINNTNNSMSFILIYCTRQVIVT